MQKVPKQSPVVLSGLISGLLLLGFIILFVIITQ